MTDSKKTVSSRQNRADIHESPKDCQLIKPFSKVAEYKINTQNPKIYVVEIFKTLKKVIEEKIRRWKDFHC